MGSVSLEAFDGSLRGKLTQWIVPTNDVCALPHGFQDQILSGTVGFQTHVLLMSKQDSKAWLLAHTWDLTYVPEAMTDWSLLLSILPHLKKPVLIVSTPKCNSPPAFWNKCQSITGAVLKELPCENTPSPGITSHILPSVIFFPKLDTITEAQFIKASSCLHPTIHQTLQKLDLRSLYRELRGAGASLCLSGIDSRFTTNGQNGSIPEFNSMWFYPEINGALRLHISDLRMILRTVAERLAEPTM